MATKKILLRFVYVLSCLFYLAIMAFHILKLYFGQISIITTFLFYLNLGFIIAFLSKIPLALNWITSAKRQNFLLTVWVTLICLFSTEFVLKYVVSTHQTYREQNGNFFCRSEYLAYRRNNKLKRKRTKPENFQLQVGEPDARRTKVTPEFTYTYQYNKEGLRDTNWPIEKGINEFRILALGDSFTEGDAAPADSTWLKSMEQKLQTSYKNIQITTINGGISGSDIVYELLLLKRKLLKYTPDLVILSLNSTDIGDIIYRGCENRFLPDNTLKFNDPPWWEPFYGISYIVRHILHDFFDLNYMLKFPMELREEKKKALACIQNTLDQFIALSQTHHFKLVLMTHPFDFALFNDFDEYEMIQKVFQAAEVEHYIDMKVQFLNDGTITPENISTYFWPLDLHHTSKGYWLWGKLLAEYMQEFALVDSLIEYRNQNPLILNTKEQTAD